jgi:putative transposase
MICQVWRVPRSSVYERIGRAAEPEPKLTPRKRGPRTKHSDAEVLEQVHRVLKEESFLGEGHKKVTLRLRKAGMRVGKNRVLRLMRENGLRGQSWNGG